MVRDGRYARDLFSRNNIIFFVYQKDLDNYDKAV